MENYQNQNQPETAPYSESIFEDHVQYEEASQGQRFLNWLIDNLLMRFGLSYLTGNLVVYILETFFPNYVLSIIERGGENSLDLLLITYLVAIFNYLFYYTICEKAFKGYTLGKLLTGTRAIRTDGLELTFKDAFLRSASRLVPFEAFSGLGRRPWHDSWTKTTVIKSR